MPAEYEFVTGLIKYYRDVELRALAGTGLVLTAVAAAVAALESDTPNRLAEALLLSIALGILAAVQAAAFVFGGIVFTNRTEASAAQDYIQV